MRVLIVDDIAEFHDLIADAFREIGASLELTHAIDGLQAIDIINNSRSFDLIISDFQMPNINGAELFRFTQMKKLNVPFILFSSAVNLDLSVFSGQDFCGVVRKHELPQLQEIVRSMVTNVASDGH